MSTWRDHVSNDTIIILNELISIKNDIKEFKIAQNTSFKIAMISSAMLVAYASLFIWAQSEENILYAVTALLTNVYHLVLLIIPGYYYSKHLHYHSLIDKKKKQLENLRLEVIDYLKNTWYINEYSGIRDEISDELGEDGINVRYKSN
ncbi:DUF2663 family protein [Virgibacillus ihumii]|uniref:DUF2663 family protein n=1 Tax=Virgibacillus ihumii TaxID=2686091 RepID=UPI00157E22F8|nr:DUF2663 family protein [Virgibacillus ihumii]